MKNKLNKYLVFTICLALSLVVFSVSVHSSIQRISNVDEHIGVLSSVFENAKKQILVTSKGVNYETLASAGLYQLIPAAVARGVKIYIYDYLEQKIDPFIINFFEKNGVNYQQALTHAKILSYDKKFVAIGSCNWLNFINSKYPESFFSTTLITEDNLEKGTVQHLTEQIWEQIRNYQSLYFKKKKGVYKVSPRAYTASSFVYEIGNDSDLIYIPTLRAHIDLIEDTLFSAEKRLIVCSNFPGKNLAKNFTREKIGELLRRGVQVAFVCSSRAPGLSYLENYLGDLFKWPNLYLLKYDNIHVLSVIVDDDTYIDSSFNWLSAARDENDIYHKHEVSLMAQGDLGRYLVDNFLNTGIGIEINKVLQKNVQHQVDESSVGICPRCSNQMEIYNAYGYRWKCLNCNYKEAIEIPCPYCNTKMKIRKDKNDYYIYCPPCRTEKLYYKAKKEYTSPNSQATKARGKSRRQVVSHECENCGQPVADDVFNYSRKQFDGYVFCRKCQAKYRSSSLHGTRAPKRKKQAASHECEECGRRITAAVFNYSYKNFDGHVLCRDCQGMYILNL